MSEASLMLQAAVVAALKNAGAVTALVGERVYDRVPPEPVFPYINYGDEDLNDDSADCVIGSEIFLPIHIWSRAVGKPQVKTVAGVVRTVLDGNELTVTDHHLISLIHRNTRFFVDPDGLTNHAVVTFRALIDAA